MNEKNTISLNIDLGIAECIRVVNDIISRGTTDLKNEIINDVDIILEVINTLDNIFIELVKGFADKTITQNLYLLKEYTRETEDFLMRRELLPVLEEHITILRNVASYEDERFHVLKRGKYREIVSSLRSLVKRLEEYRNALGTGITSAPGLKEEWNLMTLIEKAKGGGAGSFIDMSIEEIAEEIIRNHDIDLSDSISRLVGKVRYRVRIL